MSTVNFAAGIGVPASFEVVYDAESKSLYGNVDKLNCPSCCSAVSADLKLKVGFSVETGELCGFEYECGLPELLPSADVTIPYAPEGFVKIDEQYYYSLPDINYVYFDEAYAVYDRNKKVVLIGEQRDDVCMYRVCKNMCVGVDLKGKLSCFIIEIK